MVDGHATRWAVFQALWHRRGEAEVSPIDQLALWHDRAAGDEEIAADLVRIAHESTSHRHPGDGKPTPWLRIGRAGIELDIILPGRPLPEPPEVVTLGQAEVVAIARQLLADDEPPEAVVPGGTLAVTRLPMPPSPPPPPPPASPPPKPKAARPPAPQLSLF